MRFMYFDRKEFECRCCGKNNTVDMLIRMIDIARDRAEIPIIINSGFRCKEHNPAVGGSETSSHLKGLAADIHVPDSLSRQKILCGLIKAGFKRIGIGKNYIHADIDMIKGNNIWIY